MRQRVQCDLSPWLRTCAAHFAVADWLARLLQQRTPAHPRSNWVAGSSGQLVHTHGALDHGPITEQMPGCKAVTGWLRRAVWAGKLFSFPFANMEMLRVAGGPNLTTNYAITLEGRSAHSTDFRGCKGVLLSSSRCLLQLLKKDWGKLDIRNSLHKG